MAAPVDEPWAKTNATDADLNLVTIGQGTAFPSTWPINRIFLRTDRERQYINKGTLVAPIWHGVDIPIGKIDMYAGPLTGLIPGWLICDGAAVSRTTFAELFAVISTIYGVGDGSTTFNLPDFVTNNLFPRAATSDSELADVGGESEHILTEAELAAHTHIQNAHNHRSNVTTAFSGTPTSTGVASTGSFLPQNVQNETATNQNTGNDTPHENKPPFIDIHFIIAI